MDQLHRLGNRELICLLFFICNYVVSVGEVSSFSGWFGWAPGGGGTLIFSGYIGSVPASPAYPKNT